MLTIRARLSGAMMSTGLGLTLLVGSGCSRDITDPAREMRDGSLIRPSEPAFAAMSNKGTVARGGPYNLRSGPGTSYSIVGTILSGTQVTISCTSRGTTVTGVYGTTNLWDKLSSGAWISDALVYTGTSAPVAGPCASPALPVAAAPVLTPQPLNPPSSALPTISMTTGTVGATIRFTTNGSEPNESSRAYGGAITLIQTTTIKARAFKTGMAMSPVTTVTYTIVPTILRAPTKDEALARLRLWLVVDWCYSTEAFGLSQLSNADPGNSLVGAYLQDLLLRLVPFAARGRINQEVDRYGTKSASEILARVQQLQQKYRTTDAVVALQKSWCAKM